MKMTLTILFLSNILAFFVMILHHLFSFYFFIWTMLSHLSRVRLCATPETAAQQVPPSLEISRQEHWIGLPFPSPMHESEVAQSGPTLSDPRNTAYQAPPSMGFSRQEYWSGMPLPSPIWTILEFNFTQIAF